MDKHYYLISQLPVLFFDKESFFDTDSFLREAEKWMNRQDFKVLNRVSLFDLNFEHAKPRLWKKVLRFENVFRREVTAWRKARRSGQDFKTENFSLSLVKEGDPLEVEKKLLHWRWQFLDDLEREHYFDLEFLIIYFLKLQILKQLSLFDRKKGMEIFQNLGQPELEQTTQDDADHAE